MDARTCLPSDHRTVGLACCTSLSLPLQEYLASVRISPYGSCIGIFQALCPSGVYQVSHELSDFAKEFMLRICRKRRKSCLSLLGGLPLNTCVLFVKHSIRPSCHLSSL